MTAEYPQGDEPLIPMPALSLPALRQAVAAVAPSRLPEFFQEVQDAFTQAGDEDSVFPIRHFYQRWGAAIAIERRPSVPARLHAAARAPPLYGTPQSAKPPRSSRRPTARSQVADWHWEPVSDELLDGLPPAALAAVRQVAEELTTSAHLVTVRNITKSGRRTSARPVA